MSDFTTIRISKANYEALNDHLYENKLNSMDASLTDIINDYFRMKAMISDLTTRAQVNAEERDQALELLHMTVPQLHQAVAEQQKS